MKGGSAKGRKSVRLSKGGEGFLECVKRKRKWENRDKEGAW